MKRSIARSLCLGFLAAVANIQAADFKQSKVTQVVNDVQIISAADQVKKAAVINAAFTIPDILQTGPASRAELVAQDDTVTRVGANTIFSFDPASRTIDLKQGSLLFHSPHGKGGGTIHTGSATASVLGSTLIVTTTPNGGFKVIALEDEADIKLPNGLRQRLNPGQMTYILPGGTQLAPIILFRLDDLTQHSLLVRGFVHPLPSLPLILREIDKQTKLIKSDKVSDTGLLAGDNASASQVEVLDANTVQYAANSGSVQIALGTDATINRSSLKDPNIPTPPARIFLNPAFSLPGNAFFAGQTFKGFAGQNIFINTPGANPAGLTVDLSPYANKPEFDFVAAKDIYLEGSVTFSGLSSINQLALIGGDQIIFSPNLTVQADAGDFEMSTPGALTLDGVSVINNVGDVGLTSGSEINLLNNTAIDNAGHITLTAANAVNIVSDGDVNVGVSDPTGVNVGLSSPTTIKTDSATGQVNLSSTSGSVTVLNTDIQTHYLTLNSGDRILLDASGRTLAATGVGATANFTAPNIVSVSHADFGSFAVLNVAANTVTFVAVNLPLITNVGTLTGNVNVNGPVTVGWFNVINSSWQNTPITSASQITLSSGPGSTPGIYSYKNN